MIELDSFNHRMVHDGKRNNREVEITCDYCGAKSWQRWQRVKKKLQNGSEFFCSRECHADYQRGKGSEHDGKENARFHWDGDRWIAQWWENGNLKNTTKAKWLWEQTYGEVPDGYWITYKDRTPENCELDNLEIISRGERISEALMGHEVSEETKRKIGDAHRGRKLSKEHKKKIGRNTKKMWRDGIFDDPEIREAYAKQGRSTKGSKRTKEQKQQLSEIRLKMYDDSEYRERQTKFKLRGEDHPNWKGGVSQQNYPPEFSKYLRRKIRERDKNICRICGGDASGFNGRVHHIDVNKYNNDKSNLLLVCTGCHGNIHASYDTNDPVILAFRSMLKY